MLLRQLNGHTVLAAELSERSVVVDLGANIGRFSHEILDVFACRCHAVEANPALCDRLERHPLLSVYNFAIANRSGKIQLNLSSNLEASSVLRPSDDLQESIAVPAITLADFFALAQLDRVDLIKFDIEGSEIDVLDSCSDQFLQSVPQLTIEFHDFLGLTPVSTVERVVGRLQDLGFFPIKIWRHAWGDTLFINRQLASATLVQLWYARFVTRNWWGLQRVVRRRMNSSSNREK
jgi:FkbM family methyltransferase